MKWLYSGRCTCTLQARDLAAMCALALLLTLATAVTALQAAGSGAPAGAAARPAFEPSRFVPVDGVFETFYVTDTQMLRSALDLGLLATDTSVLVAETGRGKLALLMEQMAFHHVAQGRTDGQDWLISFCVVCNTGTRLVPTIDGKPARFTTAGVYDAMLVMRDEATGTLWNHITGEALHGPRVGSTLGPVGNALQMNVAQALARDPKIRVAISDRLYLAGGRVHGTSSGFLLEGRGQASAQNELTRKASIRSTTSAAEARAALSGVFASTLGKEDGRRARMDLGLGIWAGVVRRFYPMDVIRQNGNAFIDRIDGQRVLVYIDPETQIPTAVFVESARARMDGATVRLDNGQTIRSGVLSDARRGRLGLKRPQQLFTRWYGFAATFPGAEVFGQEAGN